MFSFTRDLAYILYSVVNVLSVLSKLSAFNLSIDLRKLQKVLRAGVHFSFLTPNSSFPLVEMRGLEPLAYALQRHRSPS